MSSGAAQVTEATDAPVEFIVVSNRFSSLDASIAVQDAGAAPHLRPLVRFPGIRVDSSGPVVRSRPALTTPGFGYGPAKRTLDILVAAAAIAVLLPVFILVALTIVVTNPGPVLFSQARCGQGGRAFRLLKFRTMITDAERIRHELAHLNEMSGPMFKVRLDPRVTRVGRFLRKFSVDELPQLFNVLRGDMTLVGPRPSIVAEVDAFTDHQRRRLDVKPGLTCLWQVSGRSDLGFDEWVALDLQYIEQRSFWLDLRILVRTVPAVLSGRGAY